MRSASWGLVLLLDEFDALLYNPVLNSVEFFGSLRSLASNSRGALALVIASRQSLTDLNAATQQFSRAGSPYFNILTEITLGPLPHTAAAELLGRASSRFTPGDRRFIAEIAGGQPYLLQAAASALWEIYQEGEKEPPRLWQLAGQELYDAVASPLGDTWRLWPPAARKAFTAVALAHIPALLDAREFNTGRLLRDLRDLGPELDALEKRGFIAQDESISGGWRVRPAALLWWLADELVRVVRPENPFEEWLQAQAWEGLLTRGEKQQLEKATRAVVNLLTGGVPKLIEAVIKKVMG